MGDRIKKWIAVLLAGSILAMIQLVPAGGAVFVRENIENKEILGEKETSLQQTLHARAWVLMDADSGRILAGKDADTAYPMASTTKILTCILALEQGNPDDWVEVSEKAASMPDVQLNMRAGERYRLSDLLYSLMLESHNDSAVAVAEHIGGSVEEFAEKMNRKAREIGCKNVCFVTPNGLDVADADGNEHSASAADMARLQKEVSFEPAVALAGGADGLDFYRIITRRWKPNLKNGGALLYEVGAGQSDSVSAILSENGFSDICTWRDLCGIIRVVGGINTGNAG